MTTVTPSALSLDEAMKFQDELEAKITALQVELKEKTLGLIARALIDTPGLNSIIVYGYTPGFNDGDPCYHSQGEAYLNGFDSCEESCNLFGFTDDDEDEGDEDENAVEEPVREWGYRVDNEPFDRVAGLVYSLHDGLELLFGTDWALCFRRLENDTVELEQTDYDCGY